MAMVRVGGKARPLSRASGARANGTEKLKDTDGGAETWMAHVGRGADGPSVSER